jgi:hypothetical protein
VAHHSVELTSVGQPKLKADRRNLFLAKEGIRAPALLWPQSVVRCTDRQCLCRSGGSTGRRAFARRSKYPQCARNYSVQFTESVGGPASALVTQEEADKTKMSASDLKKRQATHSR